MITVYKPSILPNITCHRWDVCMYEALLVGYKWIAWTRDSSDNPKVKPQPKSDKNDDVAQRWSTPYVYKTVVKYHNNH